MKVRFNLRQPRAKKATPINMVCRWHGYRAVFPTGANILPEKWDHRTQRPKRRIEDELSVVLQRQLDRLADLAEQVYIENDFGRILPDEFKAQLQAKLRPTERKTPYLLKYIDEYLNRSATRGDRRRAGLKTTYHHLQKFVRDDVRFDAIDWNFHRQFIEYLDGMNHELSHVNKQLGNVRQFLRAARADGHHQNRIDESTTWKLPEKQKPVVALTLEEVERLAALPLSGIAEQVRDLFLIGMMLGQRWSDFSRLTPADFTADRLIIRQEKTDSEIQIPLNLFDRFIRSVTLRTLLEKYAYASPIISQQEFNRTLKDICRAAGIDKPTNDYKHFAFGRSAVERVPKWQMISSHVARKTALTILDNAGVSREGLTAVSGHKKETMLVRYIGTEAADKANRVQQEIESLATGS